MSTGPTLTINRTTREVTLTRSPLGLQGVPGEGAVLEVQDSVADFASLPAAADHENEFWLAEDTGAIWYSNAVEWIEVAIGGGAGETNLAVANKTATTFDVTSSTGTDVTLPAATTTEAGLMPAADKLKVHDPVTVSDSTSIDFTLTGQQISAAAIFGTTSGTVAQGDHVHAVTTYVPVSMTVNTGTLDSGTYATLAAQDGVSVAISEASGADPLNVTLVFSGVAAFSSISVFGYYDGSDAHEMVVELWNYTGSTWDIHGYLSNEAVASWHTFSVPDPTDHVSAGAAQIRLRHIQNGNTSHDLFLDYVALSAASGGVTLAHEGLTGRSVADSHPASAIGVAATPSNYTAATPDVEANLVGINAAIGALGGGHDAVTLAGTPDYITITGQEITRNAVDLAADVTGALPASSVDFGAGTDGDVWTSDGAGGEAWEAAASGYTDEQAQDAVGGMVASSPTITLAYVDATPSLTANLAYPLYTTAISGGDLVINANSSVESYHSISLDMDVNAGGITITGLPTADVIRVNIRFTQATPGGTLYDVPVTAWSAFGTSRTWDTDWYCYQDATPSIAGFESIDGGVNWRAYANSPAATGDVSDGDTLTAGLTFPNTGLHLLDTNASHDLIVAIDSDLSADRTLTITTGDANRTLTLNGDATLPAGTALVSGGALGTPTSGALTNCTGLPEAGLINNAVTNAKLAQMTASTIKARVMQSTGDPEDATVTQLRAILDPVPQVVNTQTGTTYELVATDKGKLVTLSNGSAVTVDVDSDGITWAAGDRVDLLNIGAGAVTIQGGGTTAVTISKAADQTAVLAQGKGASLVFVSDTVAWLVGGMGAA